MATAKKKITSKTKKKVRILVTHPTKKELKEATKHALKQYRDAVKNLANR